VYPFDFQTRHHPPSSSFKMPSTTSKFTCPTQSASFTISDRNSSISLLAMTVPKPSPSISWLSEEGNAEIIPITSPRLLMTGPPLLPPLTLALFRSGSQGRWSFRLAVTVRACQDFQHPSDLLKVLPGTPARGSGGFQFIEHVLEFFRIQGHALSVRMNTYSVKPEMPPLKSHHELSNLRLFVRPVDQQR
jgi:hypothetical protein